MAENKNMYTQIANYLAGTLRGRRPGAQKAADENNGTVSVGSNGCLILSDMRTNRSMIDGFMRMQRA